jgi:hypothetical protein
MSQCESVPKRTFVAVGGLGQEAQGTLDVVGRGGS